MNGNKVIYEVDKIGSITFGNTAPFFCESFEATSVASNCQTNTAIGMDGQLVSDITLQPKVVPCKFAILSLTKNQKSYDYEGLERIKAEVIKLFNPKKKGLLTRVNGYGVFQVEARPSESPIFEKAVGASCRFSVNFILDNPLWRGTREREHIFKQPGRITVYNNSGVETPFILRGVVPPKSAFVIENINTGKFMELKNRFDSNLKFELNTSNCEVIAQTGESGKIEKSNHIFTAASDLDMLLESGENIIRYGNHDGDYYNDEKAISLVVHDRYIGVV